MTWRDGGRLALLAGLSAVLLTANLTLAYPRRVLRGGTAVVRRSDFSVAVRCSGVLKATNVKHLRAQMAGRVLKKYFREGYPIKKGDLLLEFDDADLRQEIARDQGALVAARHDYAKAQREVGIQKKLFSYGAIPKKNIEDAVEASVRAYAAVAAAQSAVEAKTKDLGKTKVLSPMDGFLISDSIKHDASAAIDKDMFTVGTLDAFRAVVNVDEEDLAKISVGQPAQVKVEAFPDTPLSGAVTSMAPQAERTEFAKIAVTIAITDRKGLALEPNLSVQARLESQRLPDVLTIPVRAVTRTGDQAVAYVVGKWGKSSPRPVVLGPSNEDAVVVVSGLEADDIVVLSN
ncbi:MAG: efflux RND transporter periplasmic adaptor subunit [Elusimicrobiota bacterium]